MKFLTFQEDVKIYAMAIHECHEYHVLELRIGKNADGHPSLLELFSLLDMQIFDVSCLPRRRGYLKCL